jgi:arsenate reductase-like glutaredoxin family protein
MAGALGHPGAGAMDMPADPRITLHGIPNCDTVKRARAWLAEQGVAYDFHDFKKAGVPAALPQWMAALG